MKWLMLKPMRKSKHEPSQRFVEPFKQTSSRKTKPRIRVSSQLRLHLNSWAMFSNITSTTTYATITPFPLAAIILQKQVPTPSRNSPLHSQTALPTSNTIEVEAWTSTSSHPTSPSFSAMDWIRNTPSLVVLLDVSGLLP